VKMLKRAVAALHQAVTKRKHGNIREIWSSEVKRDRLTRIRQRSATLLQNVTALLARCRLCHVLRAITARTWTDAIRALMYEERYRLETITLLYCDNALYDNAKSNVALSL
jgi:hypothetical protein